MAFCSTASATAERNCRFVNILRRHPWHFWRSIFAMLLSREAFVSVWRRAGKRMLRHSFSYSSPPHMERFVVIVPLNNTDSCTKLRGVFGFFRGTQNKIRRRELFLIERATLSLSCVRRTLNCFRKKKWFSKVWNIVRTAFSREIITSHAHFNSSLNAMQ